MAGPALPVNVDTTYPDDAGDASVKAHQGHHDLIHGVVNQLDTAAKATAKGDLLVADTSGILGKVAVGTNGQVLTADSAQTRGVAWAAAPTAPTTVATNTQTASYTLVLADAGKVVELNAAIANNLTVPANSSVPYPTGTFLSLRQYGTGQTTVVAGTGVTIRSRGGALKLAGQYAEASLIKRGVDEWVLTGDVTT